MTGSELKAARLALGWTQSDLATRCDVTWRTVARWEARTDSVPRIAYLIILEANAIG